MQCVVEDPQYAPAWARLGRICRVLAKYGRAEEDENLRRAESAFRRALEINPDLSIAHNLYKYFEVDLGRARDAMLRLVDRARQRSGDPELFAGLVHACRYCGLLDASTAAYEQAIRLDPKISTSVAHTISCSVTMRRSSRQTSRAVRYRRILAMGMLGREGEALATLKLVGRVQTRLDDFLAGARALYEGHTAASADAMRRVAMSDFMDPEGLFYAARQLAYLGHSDDALDALERATAGGFYCYPALVRDPWLDPVRALPRVAQTLRRSRLGTGRPVPLSWPLGATRCLDCLRLFRLPTFALRASGPRRMRSNEWQIPYLRKQPTSVDHRSVTISRQVAFETDVDIESHCGVTRYLSAPCSVSPYNHTGFRPVSLIAGTRLGPYEVTAQIGVGGMGEVYEARDTRLDRIVAIKVLSPDIAGDPDLRPRFEREARAIAALDHPHICAVYDVGNSEGVEFLVMPYLEGETLAARLARSPDGLPLAEALEIGGEIADALDKTHRAGFTHRDLKPANIMLTKSGAKLLDFGLAKFRPIAPVTISGVTRMATTTPGTASGAILGTVHYMAPEQLEGREADARSDIWALGAVLYEMVLGRRPFEGESAASIIGAILKGRPSSSAGTTAVNTARP